MSSFDDETQAGLFDETETVESQRRPRRRMRPTRTGGP
jgi:hypothetical protein